MGDRVAVVAAETPEIAQRALDLIEVEYEVLPAVFDPRRSHEARRADHPRRAGRRRHSPSAQRNIAVADPRRTWATWSRRWPRRDHVFEGEYHVHQVQQTPHRAARRHHLLGRGRPPGDPHQHAGAVPRAAHARAAARAAGQAHPRDQAAHRRRLWRQAGDADRGHLRAPDHRHRPPGALRVHARGGVHPAPLAPSA